MRKVNLYKLVVNDDENSAIRLKHKKLDEIEVKNEDFTNPENICTFLLDEPISMNENPVETMYMICVDITFRPISVHTMTVGTIDTSLLSARDVIINAALQNAAGIILAHNHPSGSAVPSQNDIDTTRSIRQALKICSMCLVDHIIIGKEEFASLRRLLKDEWEQDT